MLGPETFRLDAPHVRNCRGPLFLRMRKPFHLPRCSLGCLQDLGRGVLVPPADTPLAVPLPGGAAVCRGWAGAPDRLPLQDPTAKASRVPTTGSDRCPAPQSPHSPAVKRP